MKKYLIILVAAVFLTGLFGYKLLEVPTGLTLDEAAFGYNAALLAKTGRDENHRLMPIFVLSSNGTDWRQPATQYFLAGLFRLFGPSVFLLRLSSVMIIVGCTLGLFFLFRKIYGLAGGLAAAACFAMTPLVMIQAHMALDNIMPIPFTLLWILFCYEYLKDKKTKWIILSGIILGMSLYTYKGMRAILPAWILITMFVILTDKYKNFKSLLKRWIYFALAISPFILIIPWIEKHYPGAMLGGSNPVFHNIYDFFQPYLSSFDVSYLFVTGDIVPQHSTGMHGMYLLATAPWFFTGVYQAVKRRSRLSLFMLLSFFCGPLLLGLVGSVHRFSRLLMLAPFYSWFVGLAFIELWSAKKKSLKVLAIVGSLAVLGNFYDFARYYWTEYPGITNSLNGTLQYYNDYRKLSELAKKYHLDPVTHDHTNRDSGVSGKFFQVMYFGKLLRVISDDTLPKKGEILITPKGQVGNLPQLNQNFVSYRIFMGE